MKQYYIFNHPRVLIVLIAILIWEAIWKGAALWRAGRRNDLGWFIAILIFNTVGILPIIYILISKSQTKRR